MSMGIASLNGQQNKSKQVMSAVVISDEDSYMVDAEYDQEFEQPSSSSRSKKSATAVFYTTTSPEDIEAGLIYLKRLHQYYEVRAP